MRRDALQLLLVSQIIHHLAKMLCRQYLKLRDKCRFLGGFWRSDDGGASPLCSSEGGQQGAASWGA